MLHDLYLLSFYFDGPSAVMYEEDLKRRYGLNAVADALKQGLIELHWQIGRASCRERV